MAKPDLPPRPTKTMKMPLMPDVSRAQKSAVTFVERQVLLKAFLDLVDGCSEDEIARFSGLPRERVGEIHEIGKTCMLEYQATRKG